MPDETPHIAFHNVCTGYGRKQVLDRVTLDVGASELVALIGHNGSGKSTLLKAAFGLLPVWNGDIVLSGLSCAPTTPRDMLRHGVAYVPQGNRVFGELTVHENLELGGLTLPSKGQVKDAIEDVLLLFPALRQRLKVRASSLSGGEKQMLALANAFVLSPRLLLLDEPSLGLAPPLVREALNRIKSINQSAGVSVLVVEQKVREVIRIAERVHVLRHGRVAFTGPADSLRDDATLRKVYL